MKITFYELLGLVKDGKAPKKIKFRNEIYEYENHIKDNYIDCVGIEKETNERFYLSSYIGNNYISDIFTGEVEIIEEPKKIEKLDVALLGQCDNWLRCPTNKVTKQDVELNPYIIDNIRENTLYFQRKINELIDEINNLKGND